MGYRRDVRDPREQGDEPNGRQTMETGRNDLLGELARDAELERSDFIVQATEQLRKFLDANRSRISGLGGMTLIDEDPDYLSIAPDLTFRSRSRYLDEDTVGVGERHRGARVGGRSRGAVQPERRVRGLRRGGAGSCRQDRTDRGGGAVRSRRDRRRGDRAGRRGPVRRRGRRLGRRPAGEPRGRRRRVSGAAACTTSRSSSRSAASTARPASSSNSRPRPNG